VRVPSRPHSIQSAIVGSDRDERSHLAFTTTADIYSEIQARLKTPNPIIRPLARWLMERSQVK